MNVVATSLPARRSFSEGGWDVRIFVAALSERRTRHGGQALPWLQGVRTYDGSQ